MVITKVRETVIKKSKIDIMIKFTDNDAAIRAALDANAEYKDFVKTGNPKGYIFIQVENGHILLWHNTDDRFSSFLLPDELYYYRNNIDDIRRIANSIQNFANLDYLANIKQ